MSTFLRWTLGVTAALAATLAQADALQVRSLAASCAACHGTHGVSPGGMDNLAGQNQESLQKKMADFKSGKKPATLMHQISKGLSDEQISQLAAYYANIKN